MARYGRARPIIRQHGRQGAQGRRREGHVDARSAPLAAGAEGCARAATTRCCSRWIGCQGCSHCQMRTASASAGQHGALAGSTTHGSRWLSVARHNNCRKGGTATRRSGPCGDRRHAHHAPLLGSTPWLEGRQASTFCSNSTKCRRRANERNMAIARRDDRHAGVASAAQSVNIMTRTRGGRRAAAIVARPIMGQSTQRHVAAQRR